MYTAQKGLVQPLGKFDRCSFPRICRLVAFSVYTLTRLSSITLL